MYSDDPSADYDAYDAKCAKRLEERPVCAFCGEHIQDDFLYEIDGDLVCEECLNEHYRKSTDCYIEEDPR